MTPALDVTRSERGGGVAIAHPQRDAPGAERARLSVVPTDARAADQLVQTMRLVKAARFNAAARLETKQAVSLFTQSIVALYFVGLAVWQAVYVGQIDDATNRLMTFVQLVSSVFTLMLGLLEAMNDYKMKAHHLQNCALAVSELAQELRIARPTDVQEVQAFRRRYNDALRACPVNHDRIDFLFAKLEETAADRPARVMLSIRHALDVYGLYVLFLAVPPLIWWVHQ
ncbi:SLATT domain-containing protein [Hyphomicrobium sp.]|uniref:SLATT domain-containing protein n=1 Tax=Hyphomicrobium sp. TaxID=82 RepID=UPI002E36B81A|nr:SLATT domain-containing protein [Hyphomicrobium sp.]HEX2841441.1 SLATT domain-containing protein [Hyphomicrobium sp.]